MNAPFPIAKGPIRPSNWVVRRRYLIKQQRYFLDLGNVVNATWWRNLRLQESALQRHVPAPLPRATVTIRLTEDERLDVEGRAHAAGVSATRWCTDAIRQALGFE